MSSKPRKSRERRKGMNVSKFFKGSERAFEQILKKEFSTHDSIDEGLPEDMV